MALRVNFSDFSTPGFQGTLQAANPYTVFQTEDGKLFYVTPGKGLAGFTNESFSNFPSEIKSQFQPVGSTLGPPAGFGNFKQADASSLPTGYVLGPNNSIVKDPNYVPSDDDAVTSGILDQTGWTQAMKDVYDAQKEFIELLRQQGQRLNPDITIDQATRDKFAAQAEAELGPQYAQTFAKARQDLDRLMGRQSRDFSTAESKLGKDYGTALEQTQESFARRGLAFSSERDKAERLLQERANTALEGLQRSAQRGAEDIGQKALYEFGSRNIGNSFSFQSGATPIRGVPGVYGFSPSTSRSLLWQAPSGIIGDLERQKEFDYQANINQQEVAKRQLWGAQTR